MVWKLSLRCSALSMCAGRWQFRKQSMCPKAARRTLTPPLLPLGGNVGQVNGGVPAGGEAPGGAHRGAGTAQPRGGGWERGGC